MSMCAEGRERVKPRTGVRLQESMGRWSVGVRVQWCEELTLRCWRVNTHPHTLSARSDAQAAQRGRLESLLIRRESQTRGKRDVIANFDSKFKFIFDV